MFKLKFLKILKNGFTIDDVHFKVAEIKEKELESFWKDHGGHYTLCVERKNKGKNPKLNIFENFVLQTIKEEKKIVKLKKLKEKRGRRTLDKSKFHWQTESIKG